MTDKASLRKICLASRAEIDPEERAAAQGKMCDFLLSMPEYKNAALLLSYIPTGDEIDATPVIADALKSGKTVAAPVTLGKSMEFRVFRSFDELEKGSFGIMEPKSGKAARNFENCFCITPALCADRGFYRLGYGGGYYDRFFEEQSGIFSAALCFEKLRFEDIPRESGDVPVDCVVTEKEIYRRYC